jgi:hypothetical protein
MLKKFLNKLDVTLLQIFEAAFDHYLCLVEQSQTIRNRLGAVQIVGYDDGRHVMFFLELQDQFVDLSGTDGIETGGRLVE